ncbi:MAG: 1-acyl-sn-glycerol-3-phosphate acyltransferase [Rhodobacteraceae bacterium]|nr:1-acyl-sn-glycerol-3-phosphate acyltransferase [Paracoccaceae bacterium]
MFRTVELPLWLLILILAFAAVTFASHFLFPSVRWFFRRRMERVVAELNRRLAKPIQPFKLARRHDTIQRLIYDRDVLAAVAQTAAAEGIPEAVAHERALRYAREIVPAFSASLYFGFATRAARWLSRRLYRVKVTRYDRALGKVDPEAAVVFVMNHRSNMDYVLVTYLAASRTALAYAVGEWARVWPLRALIRPMGAYFVRRRSGDALYRKVLGRYVAMATAAGVTQAVFPEGGLSRDGRLQPPKLGILSYIVDGFDPAVRDVVFVPVGLNYDRVLEDRALIAAQGDAGRSFASPVTSLLRFLWRLVRRLVTGRFRKYGEAGVGFGAPLSLTAFLATPHADPVAALAEELMRRIAAEVPRLPVPLVAEAMLAAGRPLSEAQLADMVPEGAPEGLANLRMRGLVVETPEGLAIRPGEEPLFAFYANSIAHLAAAPAASPHLSRRSGESAAT